MPSYSLRRRVSRPQEQQDDIHGRQRWQPLWIAGFAEDDANLRRPANQKSTIQILFVAVVMIEKVFRDSELRGNFVDGCAAINLLVDQQGGRSPERIGGLTIACGERPLQLTLRRPPR